jgi:soluble lytic murein transglycosylase
MHGRADYWRARTLAELGRKSEAIAGYAALVQSFPLSYHAQQALARLQELDPSECKRMQAWLKAEDEQPLLFPKSAPMQQPGFRAALALLQIGETGLAAQEFLYLGLSGSHAKDTLWLLAALYDAAGAYPQASALARGRLRKFMTEAPKGEALRRWRIAYPNAFAPLVEQAAAEAHVPAAYVRAVAREESAFNPEAVSSAHAYGLIQLMSATAKQYAQRLGLPSHPSALKDPQTNLRIGSHYIEFLWKRYQDNPAIVPAAYNAGHGSVERWLRAKPNMPLDEFIESIPFGETRRYTRRVLQSYGIYAFLQQGRFPPLDSKLPRPE